MNLKKITFTGIIFIFIFSFITHNIYDWFPNFLTSILFPVNESIWEHQKMIFYTTIIWGIVEYFWLKKLNVRYHNLISAVVLSSIFNIIIFILIYTPIYIIFGHDMISNLTIYFITIIISQIIGCFILKQEKFLKKLNELSLILVPIIIIMFSILTYYPLKIDSLFYDSSSNKYGLYNYYDMKKVNHP
ncbi:MAG: DUF6512 family protein [Bacilli bacterium]|nr:DUF6512 family protein [Bacilli bacterium]